LHDFVKVLEVMSTSVYTGLNPFSLIRRYILQQPKCTAIFRLHCTNAMGHHIRNSTVIIIIIVTAAATTTATATATTTT
jgi:hypothetical protein